MLTKEQILAALDLVTEAVPVPEWGGDVSVRAMTGLQREAFGDSLHGADGKPDLTNYRAKLLVHSIVDEAGAPMFTLADIEQLGAKSSIALDRVAKVAERLNGMVADQVGAAEKN